MKIKIRIKHLISENTSNNFFEENFRKIREKVLERRRRLSQEEENSLLELLQKETLLRSEKVEFLGFGGYQLAFSLGSSMVFKLFYSRNKEFKSAQAREYRKSYEKAHNIRYDRDESELLPKEKEDISIGTPGKIMVYSHGENEDWAYGITSKIVPGNKAYSGFEGEDENQELTHTNKIPLDVLDILQDELDSYQDADAFGATYIDDAGRQFAKTTSVVSEPQRLARQPITIGRKSREQVIKERAKILLQWFEGKYDIIKKLDGHTKNTIEDILEAYLEEASRGGTDFKLGNIGVTSNGKVAFFDPMYKQDFQGGGLVTQSLYGRRIPRETRPHEELVAPFETDKKRREREKRLAQQRHSQFKDDYEARYNYPASRNTPPIRVGDRTGIADPNPIVGPRRQNQQVAQRQNPTAQAPTAQAPIRQNQQVAQRQNPTAQAPTAQAPIRQNQQVANPTPSQRARTRIIPQSRLEQLARQDRMNARTATGPINENRTKLKIKLKLIHK